MCSRAQHLLNSNSFCDVSLAKNDMWLLAMFIAIVDHCNTIIIGHRLTNTQRLSLWKFANSIALDKPRLNPFVQLLYTAISAPSLRGGAQWKLRKGIFFPRIVLWRPPDNLVINRNISSFVFFFGLAEICFLRFVVWLCALRNQCLYCICFLVTGI